MFLDIISDFLSSCPLFSGKNIIQNYLSPSLSSVGIFQVAENPILKSYTDGGALYQTVFKIILREPLSRENNFSSFYSSFSSWVESVNFPASLPALGDSFSPVSLSILNSGKVSPSPSFSEMEILCRFTYTR
ncbi:MAG: hypothetical protein IJE44_03760 [Clostridia bacterium]|nr:hypothetical protein [Clostridia bacterium]